MSLRITASRTPGAESSCFRVEGQVWTLDPATPRHASFCRRLELDAWLQQEGAIVIQVRDLGAALEAREAGGLAVTFASGWSHELNRPATAVAAAHLARRALGLGEGS